MLCDVCRVMCVVSVVSDVCCTRDCVSCMGERSHAHASPQLFFVRLVWRARGALSVGSTGPLTAVSWLDAQNHCPPSANPAPQPRHGRFPLRRCLSPTWHFAGKAPARARVRFRPWRWQDRMRRRAKGGLRHARRAHAGLVAGTSLVSGAEGACARLGSRPHRPLMPTRARRLPGCGGPGDIAAILVSPAGVSSGRGRAPSRAGAFGARSRANVGATGADLCDEADAPGSEPVRRIGSGPMFHPKACVGSAFETPPPLQREPGLSLGDPPTGLRV